MLDRAFQILFRLPGALWQQLGNSFELQQHTKQSLKQSIVKLSRNACPLFDARLQGHLELLPQLPCSMVEGVAKDGQLVVPADINFVPEVTASQRLRSRGQFGEWDSNGPGDVPPQRSSRE